MGVRTSPAGGIDVRQQAASDGEKSKVQELRTAGRDVRAIFQVCASAAGGMGRYLPPCAHTVLRAQCEVPLRRPPLVSRIHMPEFGWRPRLHPDL